MGGIHILADGLPRDYELLRADGRSDASRRHRGPLLGLILVILHNNIISKVIPGMIMVKKIEPWPGIGLLLKSTDCIAEQMKVIKWQQRRIQTLETLLEAKK